MFRRPPCWRGRRQRRQPVNAPRRGSATPTEACQITLTLAAALKLCTILMLSSCMTLPLYPIPGVAPISPNGLCLMIPILGGTPWNGHEKHQKMYMETGWVERGSRRRLMKLFELILDAHVVQMVAKGCQNGAKMEPKRCQKDAQSSFWLKA